jgi:hypothetical protein
VTAFSGCFNIQTELFHRCRLPVPFPLDDNPWLIFQEQIRELQQHLASSDGPVVVHLTLVSELSQFFQAYILPQADYFVESKVQQYLTEIHRQLRLLSADLSFYQAARTEALQQQRHRQLCDRLTQLLSYSHAIEQALEKRAETKALPESPRP